MNMRVLSLCLLVVSALQLSAQVIWFADPTQSTNENNFFRRFDSGNYPTDYCSTVGDEAGVSPSTVTTVNDSEHGKVWKVNKPKNRKRGELARAEGDVDFYAPKEGDDIYIGWRWKIDTENSAKITEESTVWQWKSEGTHDQNYPLNMEYDGDLTFNAWGPDYANNSSQAAMRTVLWRKAVPQNTWVTLVVRIKVDKDDFGGLVQFWFNGEPQKLTNAQFDKYQVNLSSDKYTANHRTNDGSGVYPKWGIYNKKSCEYNASAYFDEMKIGSSLNSVMPSGSNTVNQLPSVTITSPTNNQVVELGETINLSATASDSDGSIEKVNFKIDGGYYSNDRTVPYTGTFTPTEAGTYVIGARAFDNLDGQTEESVTITVNEKVVPNKAPTVTITSPSNNAVFFLGDNITIKADATDEDGTITKVNFKVNDGYDSQDVTPIGNEYSTVYTPTSGGMYKLGARAFDDAGESIEVFIMVEVKIVTGAASRLDDQLSIFPNPSTGMFQLSRDANWELFNMQGISVLNGETNKIDLSGFSPGNYFLKVEEEVKRIVVKQ